MHESNFIKFKRILREELTQYNSLEKEQTGFVEGSTSNPSRIIHKKRKGEHFVERFIERVGTDEAKFIKIVRAFISMVKVRRKFYLSVKDQKEFKYNYFGNSICFRVERSIGCRSDELGRNVIVTLQTII